MNNARKKLMLVAAIIFGISVTSSTMAHQYKHKQHHDNYSAHHYKHQQKNRLKPGHHKQYRYNHRPHEHKVRHVYYYEPYRYGDGLDIVLRYHID